MCTYYSVPDPQFAWCRSRAAWISAVAQFALRHAATALWKALLEHTQLMSVLEREERVREAGPEAVDE